MANASPRLRLRHRLSVWRARFSIPYLLATHDEREVVAVVSAINGVVALAVITILALLVDLPLLFPALGPSAFILFSAPFAPAAAPRSVIGGHFLGIFVGYAAWHAVSFGSGCPVTLESGGWPAITSASIAMALSSVLMVRLNCMHPPACGSALIAALGAAGGWAQMLGMVAGVILLTLQAVLLSRLGGVSTPLWSTRGSDSRPD
jgi:CBS-domain-containing membrane protein